MQTNNEQIIEAKKLKAQQSIKAYMDHRHINITGNTFEYLLNLLNDKNNEFDEDAPIIFQNMALELLTLLADPSVSCKLPDYIKPDIGKRLLQVFDFFRNIEDSSCLVAYDYYNCLHRKLSEETLDYLSMHYTKKLINN